MKRAASLPPLEKLRVFDAVARHLSFRLAGEDLSITQSAVSHHIKELEAFLGCRLIDRDGRTVALTEEGRRYHMVVARAFATLMEGTDSIFLNRWTGRVKVALLPSFASCWLIPRLPGFAAAHPEIEVLLDPGTGLIGGKDGADIHIRYGTGGWQDFDAERLLPEALMPVASLTVASPAITARAAADGLAGQTILLSSRRTDWEDWSQAAGIDLSGVRSLSLSDYNLVLAAAIEGQGVAMGRLAIVGPLLAAGKLVSLFPAVPPVPARSAHWVATPANRPVSRAAALFLDWLKADAAGHPAPTTPPRNRSAA